MFGRNILGRTHEHAGTGQPFAIFALGGLCNAKIGQQHTPANINHDVVWLDITVDCTAPVGIIERGTNLANNRHRQTKINASPFLNNRIERAALDELHGDIAHAILFGDIENQHDVRVVEIRSGDRLALESLGKFRVASQMRGKHFQGNRALKRGIKRFIHDGHAATANLFLNLIAA